MANYATLIAAIQSVITQNGNNEITGPILQQTLISVVNSLGSGYQFIGIATPETTPGTPDQKVFYIGSAGTYPNFGPAVIPDGNLAVFYYDSSWHYGSVAFPIGDGAVTESKLATALANKLLASGYKFAGIATPATTPGTPNQNIFYIGGPGEYSNFGTAQTVNDGYLGFFEYNNGWSFETVQVGKNYDAELTQLAFDLGNILTEIDLNTMGIFNGIISSSHVWSTNNVNNLSLEIPVKPGQVYRIVASAIDYTFYSFFTSVSFPVQNATPPYATGATGRMPISAGRTKDVTIPEDCNFLYITIKNSQGTQNRPQAIYLIETVPDAAKNDNDEMRSDIEGPLVELCNYATDSFTFNGTSAQGTVQKVGKSGYLITNIAKTSGKQFLFTLPDGLVDGTSYRVQFDYKSWLSGNWSLYPMTNDGGSNNPTRGKSIPATGSGKIDWIFTYYNGDKYLALNSGTQNAGCMALIENLSIKRNDLAIGDILVRVYRAEKYPNGGTFKSYFGRKIDLTERSYAFASYMASMPSHQSSACYGDYMITLSDKMATMKLYNLRTRTLLATKTQTALDANHHCNQCFFGTEKYDENDAFPLLYVTVYSSDWAITPGSMEVYRIVPTMGTNDYSSFSITLVQTVTVPTMTDDNALGYVNFVMDLRSGYLYTYSRNDNENAANYNNLRITKWKMPTLSQGNVALTSRIASWETGTKFGAGQGAAIKNHLLFFFRGYQSAGYIQMYVFDLVNRTIVAEIDLLSDGFTSEPEGVFFWGNTLHVSTNGGNLYRFIFR